MRLNKKYKSKLTKTKKSIDASNEKKSKTPKMSIEYRNMEPYNLDKGTIDLTKLRFGIIDSCDLLSVRTMDGVITLKDSWLELVIMMLSNVIENNPNNFVELFTDYGVTNQTFIVDKVYGQYSFDSKLQSKVYNIYNSGYYLEAVLSNSNLFFAIIGLTRCMGLTLDKIELNIQKKGYKEVELNYTELEDNEFIADLDDAASVIADGVHLVSIKLLNETTRVHRIDIALVAFCNWLYDSYGEMTLMSLPRTPGTGICLKGTMEDTMYTPLKSGMLGVYTDGDINGIIEFMKQAVDDIGLDRDAVEFKFRALKKKEELKEWEVD